MLVSHVIHACSERYSSTLSSPFHPTSSSPHSSSISCSPSCTSSTTLRAVVTLRTSPKRRWTQLTNPTSSQLSDGLPGKIEKVVTDAQKQVEKVVTHEQKEVEKTVKGSRRVDGVWWRHRSHVATRRSHMRHSNMAKQFHSAMHNMHKPCCTVDRRLDEHVCSLSSLDTHNNSGQF